MRAFLLLDPVFWIVPYIGTMTYLSTTARSNPTRPAPLLWTWANFTSLEMSCRHCGETYDWPEFMDRLQRARDVCAQPFLVLSAHRCRLHNARVGGAPLSEHLRLAADISLRGHDPARLLEACAIAGFTGFGFYTTFLHIDLGRPRRWYGSGKAIKLWQAYLD